VASTHVSVNSALLSSPRIFIDTGAFRAIYDPSDAYNQSATDFYNEVLVKRRIQLLTSEYVIAETLNAFQRLYAGRRISRSHFFEVTAKLSNLQGIERLLASHKIEQGSVEVLKRDETRRLSFFDATSLVLMQTLGISNIFAFDGDFHLFTIQRGFTQVSITKYPEE